MRARNFAPRVGHNLFMGTVGKADHSRITVVPGQRSGQACIRGLRITVWDILDMLASGMTEDEILRDYPYLGEGTSMISSCQGKTHYSPTPDSG
jgi:uncharacterized protein (DUF433 family)